MNCFGIVSVSIVAFIVIGSFSVNSGYGQIDGWEYCRSTPGGEKCESQNPFSTGFNILIVVIGGITLLFFYFLLGKLFKKKTSK